MENKIVLIIIKLLQANLPKSKTKLKIKFSDGSINKSLKIVISLKNFDSNLITPMVNIVDEEAQTRIFSNSKTI